jgi:hypothetical protein
LRFCERKIDAHSRNSCMRRARGVVGRYGTQTSFAACDRRAKTVLTDLTRVHSCGEFAAVQSGVSCKPGSSTSRAVSACMPVCLGSSTAARQHGSTAALGHSLGFIAVSAGVRSV